MPGPMIATIVFLGVVGALSILYARRHSRKD